MSVLLYVIQLQSEGIVALTFEMTLIHFSQYLISGAPSHQSMGCRKQLSAFLVEGNLVV